MPPLHIDHGPAERGAAFEKRVEELLRNLARDHPRRAAFQRHPRIKLRTGEEIQPDFVLLTVLPHVRKFSFIECQDREKYTWDLFRKIKEVVGNSWIKTFYVVTPDPLPDKLMAGYRADGIQVLTLQGFEAHVQRIMDSLNGLADPSQGSTLEDPALLVTLYNELHWKLPMPHLASLMDEHLTPAKLQELGLSGTEAREVLRLDEGQEDAALTIQAPPEDLGQLPLLYDSRKFETLMRELEAQGLSPALARPLALRIIRGW